MAGASFGGSELAAWCGGRWEPDAPPSVTGVSNDTRRMRAGDLYVALKGERFDGHDFVDDALSAGACGAMAARSAGLSGSTSRRLLQVDDTAAALIALGQGYCRKTNPCVVAVTGSVGKTTVKEMIADVVETTLPVARSWGNWNNRIGLPLSLLQMSADARVGVFELGSNHRGEIRELSEILHPHWGVVTRLGPAHLEFLGSIAGVADEKADLLRALPADGLAFLNRDTDCFRRLADAAPCPVVTVSAESDADFRCTDYDPSRRCAYVRERRTGEDREIGRGNLARHDVTNAMLAIAVARALDVAWDPICRALAGFQALPMRWQETVVRGIRMINDAYNANPLSMRAAIDSFAETNGPGGRWLLLGDMLEIGERARHEHIELGRFLAGRQWAGAILVGAHAGDTAAGARSAGFPADHLFVCENAVLAADIVARHVPSGDLLLLKASRGVGLERVVSMGSLPERQHSQIPKQGG